MLKINCLVIMIFILSHCSIDTKSGLWENKNSMEVARILGEIDWNNKKVINYLYKLYKE